VGAETPDREQWTVDGDGGNGYVDARAVGEAGIDQRRRFVYAASDARNHFFNDAEKVNIVLELDRRAVEFAETFHIDQLGSGDQDIGDGRILEEGFQRAQTEDFVEDLLDHPVFFGQVKRGIFFLHQLGHHGAHFRASPVSYDRRKSLQVNAVEQAAVYQELEFLIFRTIGILR
jgi:hypothetical protein